jgi:periplasmic divalent cation tolerance protein
MAALIVLTTFPADQDPIPLARSLVEDRLAACVNVLPPMQSIYRWQGAVEEAAERQVIIKTTSERVDALTARICTLHPYDLPEILVVPVAGAGQPYLEWLIASVALP